MAKCLSYPLVSSFLSSIRLNRYKVAIYAVLLWGQNVWAQCDYESNLQWIERNGRWGLATCSGQIIISPRYEAVRGFFGEIAFVQSNDRWGVINKSGEEIVPICCSVPDGGVPPISEGISIFLDEALGTYIVDTLGNVYRSKKIYADYIGFSEGLSPVAGVESGYIGTARREPHTIERRGGLLQWRSVRDIPSWGSVRWGFINKYGSEVIPLEYEAVTVFSEGLAAARKDGKWGYINKQRQWVIQPRFAGAREFREGRAAVVCSKRRLNLSYEESIELQGVLSDYEGYYIWNYIDKSGRSICPCDYLQVKDFQNKLAWAARLIREDGRLTLKWALLNTQGEEVIPPLYHKVEPADRGYTRVMQRVWEDGEQRERWGMIDASGKVVVPVRYSAIADTFSYFGWRPVVLDGKYGFVDADGNEVLEANFDGVGPLIWNGEGLLLRQRDQYGVIDRRGRIVIPVAYTSIQEAGDLYPEGLLVRGAQGWGLLDRSGRIIVPVQYAEIRQDTILQSGGYLVKRIVDRRARWGLVDKDGKERIPCMYQAIMQDTILGSSGVLVKKDDKWGVIGPDGQAILPVAYDEIQGTIFRPEWFIVRKENLWGIVDKSGREIVPPQYEKFGRVLAGQSVAIVRRQGAWGLLGASGSEVIPPSYEQMIPCQHDEHLLRVRKNGKWGFINLSGQEVIPLAYHTLSDLTFGGYALACKEKWWDTTFEIRLKSLPSNELRRALSDQLWRALVGYYSPKWGYREKYGMMQERAKEYEDLLSTKIKVVLSYEGCNYINQASQLLISSYFPAVLEMGASEVTGVSNGEPTLRIRLITAPDTFTSNNGVYLLITSSNNRAGRAHRLEINPSTGQKLHAPLSAWSAAASAIQPLLGTWQGQQLCESSEGVPTTITIATDPQNPRTLTCTVQERKNVVPLHLESAEQERTWYVVPAVVQLKGNKRIYIYGGYLKTSGKSSSPSMKLQVNWYGYAAQRPRLPESCTFNIER